MPWRENKGVCQFKRMLDGCFLVARAQEIYSITREPKSLNKNP